MKTVVLDSHALLAFFERQPGWETVRAFLMDAAAGKAELLLSIVNWGEIYYTTKREYGDDELRQILELIDGFPITIVDAGRELTREAAHIKSDGGMSYADCFAAGLAVLRQASLVTGDPEFGRVEARIPITWIPPALDSR